MISVSGKRKISPSPKYILSGKGIKCVVKMWIHFISLVGRDYLGGDIFLVFHFRIFLFLLVLVFGSY